MNTHKALMILKTERLLAHNKLQVQLNSIGETLVNIEEKMQQNKPLYQNDGLQGGGATLNELVIKISAYDRAIELIEQALADDREIRSESP